MVDEEVWDSLVIGHRVDASGELIRPFQLGDFPVRFFIK